MSAVEIFTLIALWCGQPFMVAPKTVPNRSTELRYAASAEWVVQSCRRELLECIDKKDNTVGYCIYEYTKRKETQHSGAMMKLSDLAQEQIDIEEKEAKKKK